jgi:peptide-methionine (S)-S-oxide reductase
VSGYAGGRRPNPTYEQVSTGATGHAEVVQVEFDPSVISYGEILDILWTIHDPTTLNRQGADVGTQYRSVIFYADEAQKAAAEASRRAVQELWSNPVVTEIVPLEAFYPAEEYHQDYFARNPGQGYCVAVINPKLDKLRKHHQSRLKATV